MAITKTLCGWLALRPRAGSSLAERIDPRYNSINALRLVLAFMVLVSHSIKFSTGGNDFVGTWTGSSVDLGTMGVDGFFALSGYLIVGSFISSPSASRYLWRRCLRILPGFWVCLVVTALVIGPVTALGSSGNAGDYAWTGPNSAVTYMRDNALLLIRQFGITGGYGGQPANASLYTLFYEFVCYLGVAAAGVLGLYRLHRSRVGLLVIAGWLLVLLALFAAPTLIAGHTAREILLRYGSMFFFGGLAHFLAHRVRGFPVGFLAAAGLLAAGAAASGALSAERGLVVYMFVAPPAMAYLVLGLGASTRIAHIGAKRDLSYGLYVYAWPVPASLLVLGASDWWLPVSSAISHMLSRGPAYPSSCWIEARARRLKSWNPARRGRSPATTREHVPDDIFGQPNAS